MNSKGFFLDEENHKEKLLNEYSNEYGVNFKNNKLDPAKLSSKPKNIVNSSIINGKR